MSEYIDGLSTRVIHLYVRVLALLDLQLVKQIGESRAIVRTPVTQPPINNCILNNIASQNTHSREISPSKSPNPFCNARNTLAYSPDRSLK